jgi:hypothetical protein
MKHAWEMKKHTGVWLENMKERYHLTDPGTDEMITLKWILRK